MPRLIPKNKIEKIKELRSHGWSLPEIYKEVGVGYGSVSRYIKGVTILPKYKKILMDKRRVSVARKHRLENEAYQKASSLINRIDEKEKLLILAALYWGEGGKKDFNFTNSDPNMIKVFVEGLREILKINSEDFRVSIRIYEDLNKDICLKYWSKITGIEVKNFVNVDILKGKKSGKLKYGLCRVRIKKGGNMLKYLLAVNKRVVEIYNNRPNSSTDRTRVS